LERLAHCAQVSGQLADAVRALREVVDSPAVENDHRRRAEALRTLATIYGLQGAWDQAMETRRAAAEAFRKSGNHGEAAAEWLAAARHLTAMLHYSSAIDMARKASNMAEQAGRPDVRARALGLEGNVLAMQGKAQEGKDTASAALSLALEQNDVDTASEVYRRLASVLEYSAEYARSRDVYFQAINFCKTQGADAETNMCMSCMSWVLYRTGEWKNANDMCRAVLAADSSPVGSRSTAGGVTGLIRIHRGEIKQARRILVESIEYARRHEIMAMEMISIWAMALLLEQEGNDEDAYTYYNRVLDLRDRCDDRHDALLALVTASTFFATRGKEAEMNRCVEALASIATETGNTEALAALAFALGETALMRDDAPEAVSQFERSLVHFEKLQTPFDQAQTGWRLGRALVNEGSRDEAVRVLNNAYRIARKLGARPLATRIAAEMKSIGASVEEGRGAGPEKRADSGGLTRRQLEVARLIADGLTNKEIAHKLYLSTRTVDMHVANILDRLDCRSRSEAVRKAGDLGLLERN
jgi:DNA-binding CsgD family transcriptional regulator